MRSKAFLARSEDEHAGQQRALQARAGLPLSLQSNLIGPACPTRAVKRSRARDMPFSPHRIISNERRAWMRLATHTVVFDREPDFARYSKDPSGSVIRIVHLRLAEAGQGLPTIRHYLGSVRRCDCSGWVSRCELARLFHRATVAAYLVGESGLGLRHISA
jgi:hypothetical protein